jgi:uncharacterized protein with ATP-grasp and redox domains
VKQIGLTELPQIEFRSITPRRDGHGTSAWLVPEVREWIQEHDLVLSKGQGNYEIMSELKGIFFLLMAKCTIAAQDLGTPVDAFIFKSCPSINGSFPQFLRQVQMFILEIRLVCLR